MKEKCSNCKYHADNWACTNADSSYVADFTDDEDWCSAFEEREDDE